jgi:Fibronectin type III domain
MRIRRRLAAGTALVFAALAVLSPAPAASALTIDGHQVLPLEIIPSTPAPWRANGSTPVMVTDPGDCPAGSKSLSAITLPGDELAGPDGRIPGTVGPAGELHKWFGWGSTNNLGIDGTAGILTAFAGGNLPDGNATGSAYKNALMAYDTKYSLSISCWTEDNTTTTYTYTSVPGTPVWMTSMKKISKAESIVLFPGVPAGSAGYYTLEPVVTQSVPAVPAGVTATPTPGALTASWDAVTADPAVTAYKVSVTAGGTPVSGSPFTAAATATSLVVPALSSSTAYAVSVVATNSLGDSPASTTATATPLPVILPLPAAPAGVTATPGPGSLTASWASVTADPAVTAYKVLVTTGGTPVAGSPFPAAATTTSLVVPDLSAGTAYTVSVVATNSAGDSPASTPVTATPAAVPDEILSTGTITAHVIVAASTAGTISMAVPASGAELGTTAQQTDGTRIASGTLGAVTVSDLRVAAEKTPWKVQATTAAFKPTAAGPGEFSSTALGSTPTVTGTGVTPGPVQAAGTASLLRPLANGTSGASGSVDAGLSLLVPAGTPVGAYTSVITVDLVKG